MSGRRKRTAGSGASAEPSLQFVANLARWIAEREMTPREVAARADIDSAHLRLILSGKRVVQLDTMVKLAGALGVAPAELLVGVRWVPDGEGGGEFRC